MNPTYFFASLEHNLRHLRLNSKQLFLQYFLNEKFAEGIARFSKSGFYNSGTFNSGAAASGLPWSDIRLKEDIKFIGVENGHNMWEFRYIGKPQKYIGVMSYEVMKTNPDAVHLADNGFYCVDYSKLGVEFREVA